MKQITELQASVSMRDLNCMIKGNETGHVK